MQRMTQNEINGALAIVHDRQGQRVPENMIVREIADWLQHRRLWSPKAAEKRARQIVRES